MTSARRRAAAALFVTAAAIGAVHGRFSLYWAAGGRALLDTVGDWATDLADPDPAAFAATFAAIGILKLAAALIPLLLLRPHPPLRRTIRAIAWAGGTVLALFAAWSTVSGALSLAGVIPPLEGYTNKSLWWTTVLWHPLFLIWGIALDVALFLTRRTRRPAT